MQILLPAKILAHKWHRSCNKRLAPEVVNQIEKSIYPKNHGFYVCGEQLLPASKLASRMHKIQQLYPDKLDSLLDLSCCRGYFILDAAKNKNCQRTLGIDIDSDNIDICLALKKYFSFIDNPPEFKLLTLASLAEKIQDFGGAYQTVLLINTYQYLFFGSALCPGYLDHEKIFSYLSKVCSHRLIFSNRTELKFCQNKAQVSQAGNIAEQYNTAAIRAAAQIYFNITIESKIGRYPLWLLEKRY